jgi:hypothetical protein
VARISLSKNIEDPNEYLLSLIPKIDGLVIHDGFWAAKASIDWYDFENHRDSLYIQEVWRNLYFTVVRKIMEIQMAAPSNHFVHSRCIPLVTPPWNDLDMSIELIVKAEIFISSQRKINVPVIIYDERGVAREWRCGHCDVPQDIKERTCANCGAPRALLLQEMP